MMRLIALNNEQVQCSGDAIESSGVLARCQENGDDAPIIVPFEADAIRSWARGPRKRIMSDKEIVASFKVPNPLTVPPTGTHQT